MTNNTLFKTGIIGTVVAALCCFTPLLVGLLAGVGLSAAVGWLDFVLMPALVFFIGLTFYAVLQRQNRVETRKKERNP